MSEIVSDILSSSKVVSSEVSTDGSDYTINVPSTDSPMPLLADMINLTAFYQESAQNYFTDEMLSDIKGKVEYVTEFVKNSIENPSEAKMVEMVSEMITDETMQKLDPLEKLNQLYIDLQIKQKLDEIEKLRGMLK